MKASPMAQTGKPRLVLFRTVRHSISGFLLQHLDEHVRALNTWFDVRLVDGPCDYAQACEEHQPDLCVFEVGVYSAYRSITNTDAHPQVPKLGFLHADAFDSSRAAFVADMAAWGVEWFFTTSMSMPSYTPELADRLFVWPNAVDSEVFRDYGQPKQSDVLVIGSQAAHYPWRNSVNKVLSETFATRTMPHFGWNAEPGTDQMLLGRSYSTLLNTSLFVPTCGTMARDVVRKHLEIPASHACLVTEDTPAVRAMGFRDMQNCVFAEADTVVEKLHHLLADRQQLHDITQAGHDLVHSQHTFAHRDQVRQWLELITAHGDSLRLRQQWPSGRLQHVPESAGDSNARVNVRGRDRALLQEAWGALEASEPEKAQHLFGRALNYFFIPEAAVGMSHAALAGGKGRAGFDWAVRTLIPPLAHHHAVEPDPVQWAGLIRSMLCLGQLPSALACAALFPKLHHVELNRIREASYAIAQHQMPGFQRLLPTVEAATVQRSARLTVCPLPESTPQQWRARLAGMLEACGQGGYAQQLLAPETTNAHAQPSWSQRRSLRAAQRRVARLLQRISRGSRQSPAEKWVRSRLSPIKRKLVSNESTRALRSLLETEDLDHAVLVLPNEKAKITRAIREGLGANPGLLNIEVLNPEEARARFCRQPEPGADRSDPRPAGQTQVQGAVKRLVFISSNAVAAQPELARITTAGNLLLERAGKRDAVAHLSAHDTSPQPGPGKVSASGRGWELYRLRAQYQHGVLKEVGS